MTDNDQPSADDVEEADRRNGEPGATEAHPTGADQAKKNRENDPPA